VDYAVSCIRDTQIVCVYVFLEGNIRVSYRGWRIRASDVCNRLPQHKTS